MPASSPVQGFAIKGPTGEIFSVFPDNNENEAWFDWIGDRQLNVKYWKEKGYTCVPVQITELTDAEGGGRG